MDCCLKAPVAFAALSCTAAAGLRGQCKGIAPVARRSYEMSATDMI